MKRSFLVHGVGLQVESDDEQLLAHLDHDFSYFAVPDQRAIRTLHLVHQSDERRPEGWRRYFTWGRSKLFRAPHGEQRVEFFGKARVAYRFEEGRAWVYCTNTDVAYEACYYVLHSFLGEALDRLSVHRVHGLGIARNERGALLLAPSGGGKSTLALQLLLHHAGVQLLSDDTPFVSDDAMLAFPQRIASRVVPPVPAQFVRQFPRHEYGMKYVVGAAFFTHRVVERVPLRSIVLLKKGSANESRWRPIARWRLALPLLRWLVVGHETPQIRELFLRVSLQDVCAKARLLGKRIATARRLLRTCQPWQLVLSRDPGESARVLASFMGASP